MLEDVNVSTLQVKSFGGAQLSPKYEPPHLILDEKLAKEIDNEVLPPPVCTSMNFLFTPSGLKILS